MKFKNFTSILGSLLLFSTLITPVKANPLADDEKTVKCPGKVTVLVEKIVPKPFNEYQLIEKTIKPAHMVELKSPASGKVLELKATNQEKVMQDQVILVLDNQNLEKELKTAQTELKKWKRTLTQRQNWKKRSTKAENQAEANVKKYQETITTIENTLQNTQVKAPINGVLVNLTINPGDTINTGDTIATILDNQTVKAPLDDLGNKIADGQEVNIKIKELEKIFPGIVKTDNEGKSIVINNPDHSIQADMTAMFKILIKEHTDAIVLPQSLILKQGQETFVYTVNGNVAKKTTIQTGPTHNNEILITQGLNKNDQIIVTEVLSTKKGTVKDQLQCLTDNKKIKIVIKNEATGKFITPGKTTTSQPISQPTPTTKKEEPPVEPKKIETKTKTKTKPAEQQPRSLASRFRIGASASFLQISDENFDEVYSTMQQYGIDLSFRFSNSFDIWFYVGTGNKTATIDLGQGENTDNETEFKFVPVCLDLRYFVVNSPRFQIFAGAGLSVYSFEDKNMFYSVKDTATGFNLITGTYFHITPKLALQAIFKYNSAKKDIGTVEIEGETVEADNQIKLDSIELLLGVTYNF